MNYHSPFSLLARRCPIAAAIGLLLFINGCADSSDNTQAAPCQDNASGDELKRCARDAFTRLLPQIRSHISAQWREEADHFPAALNVELLVTVDKRGNVLASLPTRSSGNPEFDITALAVVDASSPLPFPEDIRLHRYINTFYIELQP